MLYERFIRPLAFRCDPENVHHRAMEWLAKVGPRGFRAAALRKWAGELSLPAEPIPLAGLHFRHPVGLAAGFDKNGVALNAWEKLNFSFVEIGTVTAKAQPGNDRPRLFRLPEERALVNRLGFNNEGADAIARRLNRELKAKRWPSIPVGINLGKSKVTALEAAPEDYAYSMRKLYAFADYFTLNVSSPNTPGLRELQEKDALIDLLTHLQAANLQLSAEHQLTGSKPLFLKIAPDLSWPQIDEILEIVQEHRVQGIVATNTTVDKKSLRDAKWENESGGLSGRPLARRSTEIIRHIWRQTGGHLPIIGVGGVFTRADLLEKLDAGARLVQVYTGFVYQGPAIVKQLLGP